jgi:membrane fusion protein (multidrug efflux system)
MLKRFTLLLILLFALFGSLFYLKSQQMVQMQQQMAAPRPPAVIATAEAVLESRQPTLRSVGSLVAVNGIDVSSEVAGIVNRILFQSGSRVKQGEPLIELDATVDKAELAALRADQHLANLEFKRIKDLLPKKVVTPSDYDQAQAKLQAAQARVEKQEAVVARKTIRAPFDGLLGIRKMDLGQYLNAGEAVVPLQELDPLYVDYTLPERYFGQLHIGQPLQVKLSMLPDERFSAEVIAIDAAIMEGTRSIKLRATLPNPEGRLRPGMFVEVHTLVGDLMQVVTVPQTAISYNSYGSAVMVVKADEKGQLTVQRRQVEPGAVQNGRVEIGSGLAAGEQVVRSGHNKLRPGQAVTIDNSVMLDDSGIVSP